MFIFCLFFLHQPDFVPALEKLLVYGLSFHIGVQGVTPIAQRHSRVGSTAACH